MPITIELPDLIVAIRAALDRENIPPQIEKIIGMQFNAAKVLILNYAPNAPDEILDQAAIRLTGWFYDSDPSDPLVGRGLQLSGAAALLGAWRVHRAGVIEGPETPAPTPAPGSGLPPFPAGSGHYILTVENGDLVWLEFPKP